MAKKIQLHIPEPCHENWDNMTVADKGRFCGSCQKQVVDFSDMSDREIAQFFKKPSTGSVCGRFMQDQLEKTIEMPRKRIPWMRYFFQFALPAFLFSLKTSGQHTRIGKTVIKVQPQRPLMGDTIIGSEKMISEMRLTKLQPPLIKVLNTSSLAFCQPLQSLSVRLGGVRVSYSNPKHKTELKGKVIDENGEPVPHASIMLEETAIGTQALEDGSFAMSMSKKWEKAALVISSVGFEEKKVEVNYKDKREEELVIQLQSKNKLGEVVVVAYSTITKGMVIGSYATISKKTLFLDTVKSFFTVKKPAFKIYPNPVQRGSTFSVELNSVEEKSISITILDAGGRQVKAQSIPTVKGINKFSINTDSRWAAGIYFIKLEDEQQRVIKTEQIVIQ